jgi:hypothetical protein
MGYRQWAELAAQDRTGHAPLVLLLIQDLDQGGWFLRGYDRGGREVLETWHGSVVAAREWAESEYGPSAIGSWADIPDAIADPIRHALKRRR